MTDEGLVYQNSNSEEVSPAINIIFRPTELLRCEVYGRPDLRPFSSEGEIGQS
jgi:hypothetical protein